MARVDIVVDDEEVQRGLSQLARRLQDLSPVMREIAGVMKDASQRGIANEADPATGQPWQQLRDSTLSRRAKIGRGAHPILQVSGKLAKIVQEYGPDFAAVGSPMIYAPTHQFGAAQGSYGVS